MAVDDFEFKSLFQKLLFHSSVDSIADQDSASAMHADDRTSQEDKYLPGGSLSGLKDHRTYGVWHVTPQLHLVWVTTVL